MSTHVKAINTKSGLPQIMLKSNWDKINSDNPELAKTLEFMHPCDETGKREQDDEVKKSVGDKINEILNSKKDGKEDNSGGTTKGGKPDNKADKGKSKKNDSE